MRTNSFLAFLGTANLGIIIIRGSTIGRYSAMLCGGSELSLGNNRCVSEGEGKNIHKKDSHAVRTALEEAVKDANPHKIREIIDGTPDDLSIFSNQYIKRIFTIASKDAYDSATNLALINIFKLRLNDSSCFEGVLVGLLENCMYLATVDLINKSDVVFLNKVLGKLVLDCCVKNNVKVLNAINHVCGSVDGIRLKSINSVLEQAVVESCKQKNPILVNILMQISGKVNTRDSYKQFCANLHILFAEKESSFIETAKEALRVIFDDNDDRVWVNLMRRLIRNGFEIQSISTLFLPLEIMGDLKISSEKYHQLLYEYVTDQSCLRSITEVFNALEESDESVHKIVTSLMENLMVKDNTQFFEKLMNVMEGPMVDLVVYTVLKGKKAAFLKLIPCGKFMRSVKTIGASKFRNPELLYDACDAYGFWFSNKSIPLHIRTRLVITMFCEVTRLERNEKVNEYVDGYNDVLNEVFDANLIVKSFSMSEMKDFVNGGLWLRQETHESWWGYLYKSLFEGHFLRCVEELRKNPDTLLLSINSMQVALEYKKSVLTNRQVENVEKLIFGRRADETFANWAHRVYLQKIPPEIIANFLGNASDERNFDLGDAKDCAICLDKLLDDKKSSTSFLRCLQSNNGQVWNHHFHTNCILKWLKQSKNCPICNMKHY